MAPKHMDDGFCNIIVETAARGHGCMASCLTSAVSAFMGALVADVAEDHPFFGVAVIIRPVEGE